MDAPAPNHGSLVPVSTAWRGVVSPVRPHLVPIYVRGNELGQTWYAGPERVYLEQFSSEYLLCGTDCCSGGLHGQERQYLLISTDWVSLEALEYHGLKYKVAWQHYLYLNPVMKYDDVLTLFNFSWHLRQVHVSRQIRGRSAMPVPHMKSSPPPPARFFSQLEFSKPIKRLTGAGDWETPEDQEKGGGIDSPTRFIGSTNGETVQDRFFKLDYEGGPFFTIKSFNDWLLAAATRQKPGSDVVAGPYRDYFPDSGNIYFTHGDLTLGNIIVSGVAGSRRIDGIIDWEQAGWYPEYWEYCKLLYGVEFPHEWREAGWVDKVCEATKVHEKYQKDPKSPHVTLCYKDESQVQSGKHMASHGYLLRVTPVDVV
ncbi:hypothetical protein HYQ46_010110 [Verticillium longisporum]|nr:hypothetical protein HYQ46_010110 [Verticillium longisporum]